MNLPNKSRKYIQTIQIGLGLSLICINVAAQAVQPDTSSAASAGRIVPLVSDICSVVRAGDKVSLDWNPGFEHSGSVIGLRSFTLIFDTAGGAFSHASPRGYQAGPWGSVPNATPIGNGFYHVVVALPRMAPGTYQLVNARASAQMIQSYNGPPSQMTVSPVRERYCITVAPTS